MKITRTFTFAAAHHLTDYHGACERPHGHTYRFTVSVEGPVKSDGLVVDFVELKRVVQEKGLAHVDHTDLNDLLPNPSAELITQWMWKQLADIGTLTQTNVRLLQIELWEGETTSVILTDEDARD